MSDHLRHKNGGIGTSQGAFRPRFRFKPLNWDADAPARENSADRRLRKGVAPITLPTLKWMEDKGDVE